MVGMFRAIVLAISVAAVLVGCVQATRPPAAPPIATPDIESTVQAIVRASFPTEIPTATADAKATIEAVVQATIEALSTPTPSLTATPTITQTPSPTSTRTSTPEPTSTLTSTPTPTPTPTQLPSATPTFTPQPTSTISPTQTPSLSELIQEIEHGLVLIQTAVGSGSGFIFDAEGWVLTNAHVVGSASIVTVFLEGIYEQVGEVVGVDEVMDLAVIRLESGMTYDTIPLSNSANAKVGEDVIAIGFPLGSILIGSATVTKGVISSRRYSENNVTFLQTDAAINPGNSGGPLVNSSGEVVGINTSKYEQVYGRPIEGIGLAISINDVKARLEFLMSGGIVRLPWEHYESDLYYYSIDVAPGWELIEVGEVTTFESGPSAYISVVIIDLDEPYLLDYKLSEFKDFILDFHDSQAYERNAEYKPRSSKRLREGGRDYYWVTYEWDEGISYCNEHVIELISLSSDFPDIPLGYYVVGSLCEESQDAYADVRAKMLDSFRF